MIPDITIFGRQIPLYGVCFWAGIILCAMLAVLLCTKRGVPRYDIVYSAVFTMIGAVVGAKLLFLLVSWEDIVAGGVPLESIIKGGFVFYGGLGGGALGLWLYARIFHMSAVDLFDIYAPVVPLGHAIGRVGCFLAGCCYGIEYDGPLSHTCTSTLGQTPLGVALLPIQLIEAGCLVVLGATGIALYLRHPDRRGLPSRLYLTAYPIIRFMLEFFRGDRERGLLLGLSTSQWVSLGILCMMIAVGLYRRYGRKSKVCSD